MSEKGKSALDFFKPSSSSSSSNTPFLCPISRTLMADPVKTPRGHTFERACIEACRELNYMPPILSSTSFSEFLSFDLNPDDDMRKRILKWCKDTGHDEPLPTSQESARGIVERLKATNRAGGVRDQEPSSSSSSDDDIYDAVSLEEGISIKLSQIQNDRRRKRYLTIVSSTMQPSTTAPPDNIDPIEEEVFQLLENLDVSAKESALVRLVQAAGESSRHSIALCSQRILAHIIPLLKFSISGVQVNATNAIMALAAEKSNRREIVRWRVVPGLVHVLKKGVVEARANAAEAMCNLAMDQDRTTIGAFKVIRPLLENFCYVLLGHRGRSQAGLALYYLTLDCGENISILQKEQVIRLIFEIAEDFTSDESKALQIHAINIMYNLTCGRKGMERLIDAGVVNLLVRMLRDGQETDADCLAVMNKICVHCPFEFKKLAIVAGAERVLAEEREDWDEHCKGMAKDMLEVILGGEGSNQEPPNDTDKAESSQTRRHTKESITRPLSPLPGFEEKWEEERNNQDPPPSNITARTEPTSNDVPSESPESGSSAKMGVGKWLATAKEWKNKLGKKKPSNDAPIETSKSGRSAKKGAGKWLAMTKEWKKKFGKKKED